MNRPKLVAIGDSVVWGQGLRHADKFTTLFYRALTGREWPEEDMLARSGAIVGVGREGEPISPDLVPDQKARNEVPFDFPTILEQVDDAIGAENTDIVILDGGINDVLARVLSNTDNEDELDAAIRAACYDGMLTVLQMARERFSRAVILVLGYYPLLSTHSDWHKSKIFMFFHGQFGLIPDLVAKKVTCNALYFHRRQLYWLRRAVSEASQVRTLRGPGIIFVTPALSRDNSIFAGNPLLFQPNSPHDVDGWFNAVLNALASQDEPALFAKFREIEPSDADQSVSAWRQPACDVVFHDDVPSRIKCWIAPIGHPNHAGARRYADAIGERFGCHRHLSLKPHFLRLAHRAPQISVRQSLERYGLRPEDGLRACMQHMTVDCIEVVIRTKDESFAGTDDWVHLQVGPGWRWRLNEGIFDLEFTDDFERGSIRAYTIDPVLDSNHGPLHLGDIQEIRLIKVHEPGSVACDWKPQWIQVRVNGLEVFRSDIDAELTDNKPEWVAETPSYPRSL